MTEKLWYYVDHHQQRVGPIDASAIVEELRHGQLSLNSLVWHDGLSAWSPLSLHLNVLGVPEALRFHKKEKTRRASWLIPLGVIAVLGLSGFGLLFSIAYFAYQDRVLRSRVMEGLSLAEAAKLASSEVRLSSGKWPSNSAEAGYVEASSNYVSNVSIPSVQEIRITYSSATPEISGATLMLRGAINADGYVEWQCNAAGSTKLGGVSGTLPAKYAPANCRP